MKRINRYLLSVCLLAIVGFLASIFLGSDAPTYRAFKSSPSLAPYTRLSYEFLSARPFEDGRNWITVYRGTNDHHCYYIDLETGRILGELKGAMPVYAPRPGVQLLCYNRTRGDGFKERLVHSLARISFGRLRITTSPKDHVETFWLLDLKNNSAIRLGDAGQAPGAGSSFRPSPDGRFAFNKPTGNMTAPNVLLFDAGANIIRTILVNGWPIGWWSDREILVKSPANDFVLHDVLAPQPVTFISVGEIDAYLRRERILGYANEAAPFPMWNGRDYDFYLTEGQSRWQAAESYLLKIERAGPSFKVIDREFKFEWSDHFDHGPKHYLYSGRKAGEGSSAVYLRDLKTGRDRILVPDDGGREFSLPHFYGDNVIYVRSNALWRVDRFGTNHTRLFPPANVDPSAWPLSK